MTSPIRPSSCAPGFATNAEFDSEQQERDLASHDDAALVRYLAKWTEKLSALQRRYPERWRVPGWSPGEVRDALTLGLVELVRSPEERGSGRAPVTEEHTIRSLRRELLGLRRRCRLGATPMDLSEAPLAQRGPDHEARYLELEEENGLRIAEQRARAQLSHPQRRWLAAMQWAAVCGEFFEASDRLNLSAASRVLGKNRSSAQRAYRELQEQFQRERERLE